VKKKLEILLIGSILEATKSDLALSSLPFISAMEILLKKSSMFETIPEKILSDSKSFTQREDGLTMTGLERDLSTNFAEKNKADLLSFEKKGILLYDGIHASAFGAMNYIYRSKGIRIYLLESREIMIVTPYCTIDNEGFQFVQEEMWTESVDNVQTKKDVQDLFVHTQGANNPKKSIRINEMLIRILTSTKQSFRKDYYLEYLLTPPDVDEISKLSKKIKTQLWDICLSKQFKKKWGAEIQQNAIRLLSYLRISPTSKQLLKFIKRSTKGGNTDKILKKIKMLEEKLTPTEEDILEFKPNIAGFGINLNEAYRRLLEQIR
jgi:hypothetical protein